MSMCSLLSSSDKAIGEIFKACEECGFVLLVTADHGNAEQMISDQGGPHTAHTTNPGILTRTVQNCVWSTYCAHYQPRYINTYCAKLSSLVALYFAFKKISKLAALADTMDCVSCLSTVCICLSFITI